MTAPGATVPFLAATVLLGAAGVVKVARPEDTARALRVPPTVVRAGAGAELAIAAAAILAPAPVAGGLVAAAYAAFAAWMVLALRRNWSLASCGCFGRPDTPPTWAHAGLNAAAAAGAVWWAAAGPASSGLAGWGRLFFHSPWHGAPLAVVTLAVVVTAYVLWTDPVPAARRTT